MAQSIKDSFLDLERHRQLLEVNIEKLRKSLLHWQTWEAEYEGLKEEILAAESPNRSQLAILAQEYEGDLVKRKEVDELLGPEERTAVQVVNLLDRRIDYVEQNVRTIQKQLEASENKLAAATVISQPEVRNEDGLPMTEIIEELDDDGNVISSHTSTNGSAKAQMLEVLQKAGVKNLPNGTVPTLTKDVVSEESLPKNETKTEPSSSTAKPAKKGVKFTEDTKAGPELQKTNTDKKLEGFMNPSKKHMKPVIENPIIPTDESPEDAAQRREMLQYGMSEMGAVVAELELEDGSDWSDGDYVEESSDEEDEFGRSTSRLMDDDMRQRMLELEQKLGVRMMENVGKTTEPDTVREGMGRITITDSASSTSRPKPDSEKPSGILSSAGTSSTKKSVRFSGALDVSPSPDKSPIANEQTSKPLLQAPVSDVIERTSVEQHSDRAPPKKQSKFRANLGNSQNVLNGPLVNAPSSHTLTSLRSSEPRPFSQPIQYIPEERPANIAPTGPEGETIATTIVERDVHPEDVVGPDELDPTLLRQEVATEYHRVRNRMIQKQGGFMKEEEGEIIPLTEEEGGPKKMSRFKAARLARS